MVNIIQGARKDFTVRLNQSNGDPYPLTGVTEIKTCLFNSDGSELMLSFTGGAITIVNAAIGKLQVALTAAQTALLLVTDSATLEVSVAFGGDPVKAQIPNAYSVVATIC